MRRYKHLKSKSFKIKNSTKLLLVLILICFFCFQFFIKFNQNVTPKLIEIASRNIDKFTYNLLNNYSLLSNIEGNTLNNILTIDKNSNGEIIGLNYDMKTAYSVANLLANRLKNDYNALESGILDIEYYDEDLSDGLDGFVISLPMGLASNNIYLTNLGPRIPIKIKFIGSILTNIKTKVTDYGINNALVEIYVDVQMNHEIITPVTFQNNQLKYEILIGAKIINGTVPSYYGGLLETKSNILNIPIN